MYDDRDEIQKWANVWDKAVEKGIFDGAPKPPTPSSNLGDHSFFGPTNSNSTDSISAPDAEYWKNVYSLSNNSGDYIDPMEMITEVAKAKNPEMGNIASAMAHSPNPVRPDTIGKDQEQFDMTFTEKDIEDLSELKIQLHAMEDKINDFEGRGENAKKYENQITTLKKKIDDLSDSLSRSFYLDGHK